MDREAVVLLLCETLHGVPSLPGAAWPGPIVGGPDVMREQLARLREATSRPNITLQIVPFSVGAHPGTTGPFTILRFAEASMDLVFVELRGSTAYLEGSGDVDVHTASFRQLSDLALGDDDTITLLNEMERRYQ